jgi:hypothetical protein
VHAKRRKRKNIFETTRGGKVSKRHLAAIKNRYHDFGRGQISPHIMRKEEEKKEKKKKKKTKQTLFFVSIFSFFSLN